MLENMKNRRTIRKYTTQDIPDALLNELLEVAARASNTGNMQLYSVVITRDKANKEKLAPAHFNQPMITALPRLVVPIVTVTVGYPDGMPEQVERLPLGAVVHQEVYTDYTSASIDALYHDKEELEVNKQFVRENDKKTLAQVFTDVRYTKANNEYFSDVLLKVLKGQGFL